MASTIPNSLSLSALGNMLSSGLTPSDMTDPNTNGYLQNNFMKSPQFQLMYGTDNTSLNPAERFQNDPGVQMAIKQGMKPLQNSFAARGLQQSGALGKAMADYMYNYYNQFNQGQSGLFSQYQNQLNSLMTGGLQANASDAANQMNASNALAQLLGQGTLAAGNTIGAANLATGSNISSLFANQGSLGASAYLNTGAAQANNMMQGLSLALQLYANQQAAMASGAAGAGAMNGAAGGF